MKRTTLGGLLRDLHSKDPDLRAEAAHSLSCWEPHVVPLLTRLLRGYQPEARQGAALALSLTDSPAAGEVLGNALGHWHTPVRIEAAIAVGAGVSRAGEVLRVALRPPRWFGDYYNWPGKFEQRARAARALAGHPGPKSASLLRTLLTDPRESKAIHVAAALALIEIDGVEAIAYAFGACALHALPADHEVVFALAKIGASVIPRYLVELGDSPARANLAAEVLVRMGAEASPMLAVLLTSEDARLRGRASALLITAGHRDIRTIPDLVHGLGDPLAGIREMAARALSRLAREAPHPSLRLAIPVLRRHLSSWNETSYVTVACREALVQIERAAEGMPDFPLPAAAPQIQSDRMPLPAAPAEAEAPSLPRPM